MTEEIERDGIVFTKLGDDVNGYPMWKVLDLTDGPIGYITFDIGPGFLLSGIETNYMDWGQLHHICAFIQQQWEEYEAKALGIMEVDDD